MLNMTELEEYDLLKTTRMWLDKESQPYVDKLNNNTASTEDRVKLKELECRYLHLRKELIRRIDLSY